MTENMRYYEAGRSVPKEAQKPFNNGRFSGTDINPMWRIKTLTEMFGPAGIGWYTEVIDKRVEATDEQHTMCFVDINLYVKDGGEWSKPIYGTGGNQLKARGRGDDEGWKKAYTDALSIACKSLGIGADIWYANDPTSKYTNPPPQQQAAPKAAPARPTEIQIKALKQAMTQDQWLAMQSKYGTNMEKLTMDSWVKAAQKVGMKDAG